MTTKYATNPLYGSTLISVYNGKCRLQSEATICHGKLKVVSTSPWGSVPMAIIDDGMVWTSHYALLPKDVGPGLDCVVDVKDLV